MDRWQAVIFDLDDTLYPEREYVLSGLAAVAQWADANLGVPVNEGREELIALFESGVRGDTFDRWLAMREISAGPVVSQLVEVYRGHNPCIHPYPDAIRMLHTLVGRLPLGIVSDGYLNVQRRKLAALGIEEFFEPIIFSDEWGRTAWKPSPVPFEMALARLGSAPEWSIYVGDNPLKDFAGPRRLAMMSIWIRRPDGIHSCHEPPSAAYKPDLIIETLDDLPAALGQART